MECMTNYIEYLHQIRQEQIFFVFQSWKTQEENSSTLQVRGSNIPKKEMCTDLRRMIVFTGLKTIMN